MKSQYVVQLDCRHITCKSHAIDYIENHYGERITCPDPLCMRGITEKQILEILGKERYDALRNG